MMDLVGEFLYEFHGLRSCDVSPDGLERYKAKKNLKKTRKTFF